jgi:hypothetical protein
LKGFVKGGSSHGLPKSIGQVLQDAQQQSVWLALHEMCGVLQADIMVLTFWCKDLGYWDRDFIDVRPLFLLVLVTPHPTIPQAARGDASNMRPLVRK